MQYLSKVKFVIKTGNNYNPGQKVLGHLPFFTWFCMEFAANLRCTLINTALTRFLPHPPPPQNKLRSIKCTRYVKGV